MFWSWTEATSSRPRQVLHGEPTVSVTLLRSTGAPFGLGAGCAPPHAASRTARVATRLAASMARKTGGWVGDRKPRRLRMFLLSFSTAALGANPAAVRSG